LLVSPASQRDGSGALYDADDLVAHAPPAVVHFVFEHVDAFDEQGARVVYYLCFCFLLERGETS